MNREKVIWGVKITCYTVTAVLWGLIIWELVPKFRQLASSTAEREKIKAWVFYNSIDDNWKSSIYEDNIEDFMSSSTFSEYSGAKVMVDGMDGKVEINPYKLLILDENDICNFLKSFSSTMSIDGKDQLVEFRTKLFWDAGIYRRWSSSDNECDPSMKSYMDRNAYALCKYFAENDKTFKSFCKQLNLWYRRCVQEEALSQVQVKDVLKVKSGSSKQVSSSLVTYQMGEDFYVLVELEESKSTGQYKVSELESGNIFDIQEAIDIALCAGQFFNN